LKHAEEIKGKLGEKIRDNAELGILSKELATIITDAPIDIDQTDITRDPVDEAKLKKVFEELEFRTLARRVLDVEIAGNLATPAPKEPKSKGGQYDLFSGTGNNEAEKPSAAGQTNIENTEHLYQCIEDEEA